MKRYKLIKEYPGSPKLGTEMKDLGNDIMYSTKSTDIWRCSEEIRNHPKFWKEIVGKDYEILSFKQDSKIEDLWTNFGLEPQCWCRTKNGFAVTKGYTLNEILNNPLYSIHSVKRLSDNAIFTIGDKAKTQLSDYGNIIEFENKFNDIYITAKGGNNRCRLNDLIKCKKKLFTTEDGVDIFEGDKTCWINDWTVTNFADWRRSNNNKELHFSTREAAEEYILINKPCLSLKDVSNYYKYLLNFSNGNSKGLRELVKSKLK